MTGVNLFVYAQNCAPASVWNRRNCSGALLIGRSNNIIQTDGTYTYSINGSAQVIFTDTDSWDTATKFIISDASGVLANQEPLVSSGETVTYTLTLPAYPATEE